MASTNKTPNLELSQFIATDKPSWLGDYNSDMSKIDTAVSTNKASIDGLDSLTQNHSADITKLDEDVLKLQEIDAAYKVQIEQNAVAIANIQKQLTDTEANWKEADTNLQSQITNNQTAINTQTGRIDQLVTDKDNLQGQVTNNQQAITSLQNTDMELSEDIQDLQTEVKKFENKFNFEVKSDNTNVTPVTKIPGMTATYDLYKTDYPAGTLYVSHLYFASNEEMSLFKFYGNFSMNFTGNNVSATKEYAFDTGIVFKNPPSEAILVNNCMTKTTYSSTGVQSVDPELIIIGTDGHLYIRVHPGTSAYNGAITKLTFILLPTLYIFQNFNDDGNLEPTKLLKL